NVVVLMFEDGQPRMVAKANKHEAGIPILERETAFLERAERALGQESLAVRWPRFLGRQTWNRLHFFQYEFIDGRTLRRFLYPHRYRGDVIARHIHRLVEGYVALARRLTQTLLGGQVQPQQKQALLETLEQVRLDNHQAQAQIEAGCATF